MNISTALNLTDGYYGNLIEVRFVVFLKKYKRANNYIWLILFLTHVYVDIISFSKRIIQIYHAH